VPDRPLELTVEVGQSGTRLDRFLAEPLGSRSTAQALIEAGQVQVNGIPRAKRHILQAGDVVVVMAMSTDEPGASECGQLTAEYAIAYEDEHLLVVDKPAGVVVHPARGHWTGTLSQALAGRSGGGEEDRPGIVHRLDRDTSGLLVVARTEAVHRALKSLLSSRRMTREYLALVDGHPPARSGTIDAPIGRDRRDRLRMSLQTDAPRRAVTHFEVRQRLTSSTLLGVRLETGRTHQIRVHLAAIGHPVSGDPLYGEPGRFGLQRQFLHAQRLAFPHPVTGEALDVLSELPEDLREALDRAGGEGPG
jgi:23S rRNA pseudouridine1911/1915/1917 synthase